MAEPLVSVIMIFFNAAQFMEEAIQSVFAQTFKDWEFLLVDDGSTDESTEIALGYARNHPGKVSYLQHQNHLNRGMSATRNLGIHHARGAYIAFLDGDDIWSPRKLEQQVSILTFHPEAVMVYGQAKKWFSWTGKPEDSQRDTLQNLGVPPETVVSPPVLFELCFLHRKATTPCPSDILARREVIERVGGFEESFLGIHQSFEDQAFFAKLFLREPVYVSGECWLLYRQHPQSSVSRVRKAGQRDAARLFFLSWLAQYLSSIGTKDPKIWRPLHWQLWRYRHPRLYRLLMTGQVPISQTKTLVGRTASRIFSVPARR